MLESQRVAGTLLPLLKFTKECSGLLEQQRGITAKEIRERHSTPRMVIPTSKLLSRGLRGDRRKGNALFALPLPTLGDGFFLPRCAVGRCPKLPPWMPPFFVLRVALYSTN